MTFKDAVESTATLRGHFQKGLQALGKGDRSRVSISDTRSLSGSVHVDKALRKAHPNDARWDYGLGINTRNDFVIWLEVHPASSQHIDEVLAKLRWLRRWLASEAAAFEKLRQEFHWIASGSISFPRGSRHEKRLAQEGLRFPVKRLDLDRMAKARLQPR